MNPRLATLVHARPVQALAVAALYFATARLGFMFAIPPGNVTVVWPPSGIALAAVLLGGPWLLGGVWLGSFFANAAFFRAFVEPTPEDLLVAGAIATGSTLQALAAAGLLRRTLPALVPSAVADVLRFAAIAALCCAIAASCGVGALWLAGKVPADALLATWLTWWLGDACGVLLVTPAALLLAQPDDVRRRPGASAFPLLCLGIGLALVAFTVVRSLEQERRAAHLDLRGRTVAASLQRAVDAGVHDVESLAAYVSVTPDLSPQQFGAFARHLLQHNRAIEALSFNRRMAGGDIQRFDADLRQRRGDWPGVHEIGPDQNPRPVSPRPHHTVVEVIEPVGGNEAALGFDIGSEAVRAAALQRSEDARKPVATGVLRLVQERRGHKGFLLVWPVWRDGGAPNGRVLRGFAVGVFRVPGLVTAALQGLPPLDLALHLYDAADGPDAGPIDSRGASGSQGPWIPSEAVAGEHSVAPVHLPGRIWTLIARFDESGEPVLPWLVLAALLAFSALLAAHLDARHMAHAELHGAHERLDCAHQQLKGLHGQLQDELAQRLASEQKGRELEAHLRQSQTLDALGRLAGGVAHDFNNLLTIVLNTCELRLGESGLLRDEQQALREIREAALRGAALTGHLLALSRRQVLQPVALDVAAELGRQLAILQRLVGSDVILRLDIAPDVAPIRVDRAQFHQVLLNLAANARAAMPAGGTLEFAAGNCTIDAAQAPAAGQPTPGAYVELRVRDTGAGMDAATRQRLFEPFFTTKAGEGTGLGLATVYGIVVQSGGAIAVASEPGQGAEFRLLLPRAEAADQPPPRPRTGKLAAVGPRGKVLVVEDDAAIRMLVLRVLERQGHDVTTAASGEEAAELARGKTFELLVSDVVMPGMSGPEVAALLQREQPSLRVLYMSGFPADALHTRGLDQSAEFLAKPFSPAALAERVAALVKAAQAPPHLPEESSGSPA